MAELGDRWAALIEEDLQTDGLWNDAVKFFEADQRCGPDGATAAEWQEIARARSESRLTEPEIAAVKEAARRVAKHLRSYR